MLEPKTRYITKLYREAVAEGVQGENWYSEAQGIAQRLADQHGLTLEQVAGILAALSPQNSWGANVKLAQRFLAGRQHDGYFKVYLAFARRILAGEHPLDVMQGEKTRNFYLSIVSGGTEGVTVDRHAFDLAVNIRHTDATRPRLTKRQYAVFADKYTRAAKRLGVPTAVVQSVTWIAWRKKFWAEGAFDYKEVA